MLHIIVYFMYMQQQNVYNAMLLFPLSVAYRYIARQPLSGNQYNYGVYHEIRNSTSYCSALCYHIIIRRA